MRATVPTGGSRGKPQDSQPGQSGCSGFQPGDFNLYSDERLLYAQIATAPLHVEERMDACSVNTIVCPQCHAALDVSAEICHQCGAETFGAAAAKPDVSASNRQLIDRPWLIVVVLLHVGLLGIPMYWKTSYSLTVRVWIVVASIAYTVFAVGLIAVMLWWIARSLGMA